MDKIKLNKIKIKYIAFITFIICNTNIFSQQFNEYELKAGYLINFSKFITWPENNQKTFVIGVYGQDPFGITLEEFVKINDDNEKEWLIEYYTTPEEIDICDIIFITKIERSELLKVFEYLNEKPILSVGDNLEEFCELGGIINFTSQQERKRFKINPDAADKSRLSIDSRLLELSNIIHTKR